MQKTKKDMPMEIRRILAPTDFSDHSKQAIVYALELARAFRAKLILLHVLEVPLYPTGGFTPPGMAAMRLDAWERQARLDLAAVLSEGQAAQIEIIRRVVIGTASRTIIEVAEAEYVDLIVMATHGRSGFSHLFMGSVAERVVRLAPCPVLTIRPTAATALHGDA
jgi:nucleotide-binding universal stress UspA family protein